MTVTAFAVAGAADFVEELVKLVFCNCKEVRDRKCERVTGEDHVHAYLHFYTVSLCDKWWEEDLVQADAPLLDSICKHTEYSILLCNTENSGL